MKVLCVDNRLYNASEERAFPVPQVGETYTVVAEEKMDGTLYYELAEFYDPNDQWLYESECFIPLSNIDETEMKRTYEKEYA